MHVSHAYTLRKTGRTFIWGFIQVTAGGGGGKIKPLVTNHKREFDFLTFRTY